MRAKNKNDEEKVPAVRLSNIPQRITEQKEFEIITRASFTSRMYTVCHNTISSRAKCDASTELTGRKDQQVKEKSAL
jgi:hypothetical protein